MLYKLLLPGVATFAVLMALMAFADLTGYYDQLLWREPTFSLSVYGVFWCGLIPAGSLGAWLSRRAGGSPAHRLLAALFPVAVKVMGYLLLLPVALITSGSSNLNVVYGGFGFILVKYILAPSSALLLGAIPLLGTKRVPPGPGQTAT